jgi:hypothetical protein
MISQRDGGIVELELITNQGLPAVEYGLATDEYFPELVLIGSWLHGLTIKWSGVRSQDTGHIYSTRDMGGNPASQRYEIVDKIARPHQADAKHIGVKQQAAGLCLFLGETAGKE